MIKRHRRSALRRLKRMGWRSNTDEMRVPIAFSSNAAPYNATSNVRYALIRRTLWRSSDGQEWYEYSVEKETP